MIMRENILVKITLKLICFNPRIGNRFLFNYCEIIKLNEPA
jgi:hypothetical protein